MPFQLMAPICAGSPFAEDADGENSYSCFTCIKGRKGVYVFERDGDTLYVGECHAVSPQHNGLRDRIAQHYRPGDTGGNFRINYCREHCTACQMEDKQCRDRNEPSFRGFRSLLESSKIWALLATPPDDCEDPIKAVEYALICLLRPKYNDEIQRERRVGHRRVRQEIERVASNIRRPA